MRIADVPLLTEVSQDAELRELLLGDRKVLEKLVAPIYERAGTFRQNTGHEGAWEVENPFEGYEERPEIAELSKLFLLRIHLVNTALQSPALLEDLGRAVTIDLLDRHTEWGGALGYSGKVSWFQAIPPVAVVGRNSMASVSEKRNHFYRKQYTPDSLPGIVTVTFTRPR